ncbi:MAG: Clp protease ClpP [Oscillospiraceae bacterium]|nr:Clp protease ClpP [Oscillospiraceae bacterium]
MKSKTVQMLNGSVNPEGTAPKFWNVASLSEEEGEITLYGDVLSKRMYDWWTGEVVPGLYITPEGFMEDLSLVKDKKNITVKINSCGGDLYTGLAIHNALKGLTANVKTVIEGIAASAASVIAMAGDTVEVYPGSLIMIHGVSIRNYGDINLQDVQKMERMIDANEKAIAAIYNQRTGIDTEEIRTMMAEEKWMTGEEAVEKGFADKICEEKNTVDIGMSSNKKILMVNGISHDTFGFRNMPEFRIITQNSAKPVPVPVADSNSNEPKEEGGKKHMTFDELRTQEPDLVTQIQNEAVSIERQRMKDIDSIAASIPDQEMVNEAKYGENSCTAQELSFRVLQNSAKEGRNFLSQMESDSEQSGVNNVGAAPNSGDANSDDEKDAVELKNIVNLYNSMKGETK